MGPTSISRRIALGALLGCTASAALARPAAAAPRERGGGRLLMIAHRGGVVTEAAPENSLAALEGAIRRGYTHAEVDLRITKDGRVVCLHDRSLIRTTGLDLNVDEVTLAELHARVSPAIVPTLEAFAARAAGHIGLMPDVKGAPPELAAAYADGIRATLVRRRLMADALFIGRSDVIAAFAGPARVAWRGPFAEFERQVAGQPGEASKVFAFNHTKDFDAVQVAGYRRLCVPVVVTVNTLHYAAGDPMSQGRADIEAALRLGVDGLQIDSAYEPFAPEGALKRAGRMAGQPKR